MSVSILGRSLGQWVLWGLAVFFVGMAVFVWTVYIVSIVYGKLVLYKKKDVRSTHLLEESLPGVSILKPLCSTSDPNLAHNLESFFTLDYPKYEMLLCVQDVEDMALVDIVEGLKNKFPNVPCQIFYGGHEVGVNPKVNNMYPGYVASKHELIMVSDGGIRMREDMLTDMVACMTKDVGLVHQLPFCSDRSGLGATLEKIYFGANHARAYLFGAAIRANCASGMSMLMRKDALERAGGIQAFGCYLAEDYFMAQAIMKQGLRLRLSTFPVVQNSGDVTVGSLLRRLKRWSRLRTAMLPHFVIFEPLTECMLLGVCVSWAIHYFFASFHPIAVFATHVLAWFIMDWTLLRIVQNGPLSFSKFEYLILWLVRELSSPYLFLVGQLSPTVRWRGKEYYLRWGGIAEHVNDDDTDHEDYDTNESEEKKETNENILIST